MHAPCYGGVFTLCLYSRAVPHDTAVSPYAINITSNLHYTTTFFTFIHIPGFQIFLGFVIILEPNHQLLADSPKLRKITVPPAKYFLLVW
jgi:hypothetical protein